QLTVATSASATFTFSSLPGGPNIPSITIGANSTGPVCVTATASFPPFGTAIPAGSVSITENLPSGFTLSSISGGTQSGNTVTATIVSGQTTTVTFTNAPTTGTTGTLVVCKQIVFTGPLGGTGGIGGIGGIGGLTNTFTFTTSPAVTIQAITVPFGTTTSVCAPGVSIAVGTVTITENVP